MQTSQLHLAAVAALVSLITAWQTVFGTGSNCENSIGLRRAACRAQVEATGGRWIAGMVVIGVSVVLLALIAMQVMRVSEDSADILSSKKPPSRPGTMIADHLRGGDSATLVATAVALGGGNLCSVALLHLPARQLGR